MVLVSWCHRIGWWENLQESPIFDDKNNGFLCRCSPKPIQWWWHDLVSWYWYDYVWLSSKTAEKFIIFCYDYDSMLVSSMRLWTLNRRVKSSLLQRLFKLTFLEKTLRLHWRQVNLSPVSTYTGIWSVNLGLWLLGDGRSSVAEGWGQKRWGRPWDTLGICFTVDFEYLRIRIPISIFSIAFMSHFTTVFPLDQPPSQHPTSTSPPPNSSISPRLPTPFSCFRSESLAYLTVRTRARPCGHLSVLVTFSAPSANPRTL